ncbi:MAG TPA: citrate synthase [Phycisphaerae bacterium]|jgi:citrate synthase|nr:citrate synthase [Phycisphaerae bacterium]
MSNQAPQAQLLIDGKTFNYPVVTGTEGERGIDIAKLRADTGMITLDPAFGNTGSCQSAITFIDGDQGILRYRGIPIEEFAKNPDFIEVAWLLIFGQLPKADELQRFRDRLTKNAHLHEAMKHHFEGFPTDAPPMAMLSAMINTLGCFHSEMFSIRDEEIFEEAIARLISKVRTITAFIYRKVHGLPYIYADPKLRYCANLLHMMYSMPYDRHQVDPEIESALNLIFILHADHEQNCSTSTVRMVGSSKANLFASVAAGVCALWGPLHGGANVEVLDMLDQIHKGGLSAEKYLELAKQKGSGVKLMGFGHRVYKNYDPRAKMLQSICESVLKKLNFKDPLLDIARRLEETALKDPYFVDRKLYPNVDFYSGIIMRAMGIPTSMFTVMFAIGRLPGWIAHWKEQHDEPTARIARPRQIYTGPVGRHYVPVEQR